MPRLMVLPHLYLIFRIIACSCLSGENFHDRLSLVFYRWAATSSRPADDLADPFSMPDPGVCICEGALAPTCSECPQANPCGDSQGGPMTWTPLVLDASPAGPAACPRTEPPTGGALAVRALLQSFRC